MKHTTFRLFLANVLYMGVFAAISVFLMNLFLSDILFTLVHGLLGDTWYFFPYFLSVLLVTSGLLIFSWRIHVSRAEAEIKRDYYRLTEGQPYDKRAVRALRRQDTRHRAILLSALVVSAAEGLFVSGLPFLGPFQFALFWLVEDVLYMKKRRRWDEERMRK